jgi:hypothetical protein
MGEASILVSPGTLGESIRYDPESVQLQLYIEEARRLLVSPVVDPAPAWLLNEWSNPVWLTFAGVKTRQQDGKWVGTAKISWDILLPNGYRLTDARYAGLLQTCKSCAVLYRDGLLGDAPALSTWRVFCYSMKSLCAWLVLHENAYKPEHYSFALLDQTACKKLFNVLGSGGWTGALYLSERIIGAMYRRAYGAECPTEFYADLGKLPPDVCERICQWLRGNGGYCRRTSSRGQVSRRFLAELVHTETRVIASASMRLNAIIRQFEPGMHSAGGLLLTADQATEFPTHRTQTIAQVLASPTGCGAAVMTSKMLDILLATRPYLSDQIPASTAINRRKLSMAALRHSQGEQHTPFIPINIGLKYLGESIRWIHLYGDELVDFYLSVIRAIKDDAKNRSDRRPGGSEKQFAVISAIGVPTALADIGKGFNRLNLNTSKELSFSSLRSEPTLHQAIECWIGAVVVVLAMLKPSRSSELANVRRDCLLGDGPYWFESDLAKRTVKEYRAQTGGKPIPDIAARAIRQLQRFGEGLAQIFDEQDEFLRSRLFYLPNREFGRPKATHDAILNHYLDRFCDYVGLTPDVLGRRWYVRVHEMRKWFLLLLVWCGRFNVLDAARWIAGHVNLEHLKAYIEREDPHESLSEIEGLYAIDRLRAYEKSGFSLGEEDGLNELYEKVLLQFGVAQLELIPSRSWENYVRQLHADGEFSIELFTISAAAGEEICVAFRSTKQRMPL